MFFPPVANWDVNKHVLYGNLRLSWNLSEHGALFTFRWDEFEIWCGAIVITIHSLAVLMPWWLRNGTNHSSAPAVTKTNIPLTPRAVSIILKKKYFVSFSGLQDNCLAIKQLNHRLVVFCSFSIPCLHLQAFWCLFFLFFFNLNRMHIYIVLLCLCNVEFEMFLKCEIKMYVNWDPEARKGNGNRKLWTPTFSK